MLHPHDRLSLGAGTVNQGCDLDDHSVALIRGGHDAVLDIYHEKRGTRAVNGAGHFILQEQTSEAAPTLLPASDTLGATARLLVLPAADLTVALLE
jgi:hypothetical protein